MTVVGRVRTWRSEEGWGVLDSIETPGGCWAHFSAVAVSGFRELRSGQEVEFAWEPAAQDGYDFRAVSVWPLGEVPHHLAAADSAPSSALWSQLVIDWDRVEGQPAEPRRTDDGA